MVEIGTHVKLSIPYEAAVTRVTDALKAEGFGVLTEIDVKATLKKKLDADFRRYIILGACNPALAHRALGVDLDVGLLLPCNVIVYESAANTSEVALVDPIAMLGVMKIEKLEPIALEARSRLERVAKALKD
jgi:uncharacterized protein (DUF302 family)